MSPPESSPPHRFRPITWPVWAAWVLVAASIPPLGSVATAMVDVEWPRDAPVPVVLVLFGIALALALPPILQGFVLRRVLPKVSVAFWFCCVALSAGIWVFIEQSRGGHAPAWLHAGLQTQQQFNIAVTTARLAGGLQPLSLPWGPLLLWTVAVSFVTALLPAWALGSASGHRRHTMVFLTAAVTAACAATIVDQLYGIYTVHQVGFGRWSLNNKPWPMRLETLATRAGIGAVWGATGALVVAALTRRLAAAAAPPQRQFATFRPAGLAALLAAVLAIAYLAPFAGYLAGPRGVRSGAPALLKSLTVAPGQDRSEGETVLIYSHDVAVPISVRSMTIAMAPDNQSAIIRSAEHALLRIDLATGRTLGQVAEPLAPLERYELAWSPDGRFLALRSNGDKVTNPNNRYARHQIRLRIFTLPDYTPAGEFSNREGDCFDSYASKPVLFEPDGNSLWLACAQHTTPKPDDIMAIRLEIPSMRVLDTRRYGERASSGEARGLERVGDSVWAWQFPHTLTAPFRVRDLTHDRDVLTLSIPAEPTANLTAQGVVQIDQTSIKMRFCGVHSTAPDAAQQKFDRAASICRTLTFATPTGALIDQTDSSDVRFAAVPNAMLIGHGLRIESTWRNDSKTGETVIRDIVSGRELQRIVAVTQRPLQFSPDGRWLAMYATDRNVLRIYRIRS